MQEFDWVGTAIYVGWWYLALSVLKVVDCLRFVNYAATLVRQRSGRTDIPMWVHKGSIVFSIFLVIPLFLVFLMYSEGFRFLCPLTHSRVYEEINGEPEEEVHSV